MTTYLFALGVNEYRAPLTALQCCQRDAREMVAVFKERYGFNAHLQEDCTQDGFFDSLRRIESQLSPGDTFILYFSGHGKSHANDHFLLLPGVDLEDLAEADAGGSVVGALSYLNLKRRTSRAAWRGVSRLFIFDACRTPLIADKSGAPASFQPGFLLRDPGLYRKAPVATSEAAGRLTVLNSCDLGASASELPGSGHGLFTASFLDLARTHEDEQGRLRVDAGLCEALEEQMQRRAAQGGLPPELRHRPAMLGPGVELVSTRYRGRQDEETEWALCSARPTPEKLERFVSRFPGSRHVAEAVKLLRQFHAESKPVQTPAPAPRDRPGPAESVRRPTRVTPLEPLPPTVVVKRPSLRPPRKDVNPAATAPAATPLVPPAPTESAEPVPAEVDDDPGNLSPAEAARRDERLWELVKREPTEARLREYLREASIDAPMRQAAYDRLRKLQPAQAASATGLRKPARAERPRVAEPPAGASQAHEWNPDPGPEFKLSLDRAVDLFKKGRR